ncbi:hypothetical protein [Leifsonia poae]|uniref:DUF8094 domain-containing protein n=1 Tax=Leifsonia poae TaxID=110933 RepID=A0A9W6HDK8_9MICO|nr:hypothetical protein [Leifsonia poae]GLJ77798.1 hypothetical protein GCM10017584_33720 [Leifsonia poae]
MRFVLAIVAFVVAAVMIAVGIAQRTVFAPPSQVAVSTTVSGDPRYIVIDGTVLNAHPGQQTMSVTGGSGGKQVVAYGRTADVTAWLGDQDYTRLTLNTANGTITTKKVTPSDQGDGGSGSTSTATPAPTATPSATPSASADTSAKAAVTPGPNPAGSDLWLEEFDGDDAKLTRMNVPDSISVIVAADGTQPAPNTVRVVWPLDTSTPWAGPLIVGGLGLLVVGLALYLWGLYSLRKSRGPRRKGGGGPKMPKLPKAPRYKPSKAIEATPKGRRSTRRALIAVPVVLVGALGLTGCTSEFWSQSSASAVPTASPITTDLPKAKDVMPPSVTVPQLERIMKRISATTTQADAKRDATLLATRFSGPALELRKANYTIRTNKSDVPALPAISAGPLAVSLPQSTDTWPRVVMTVVKPAQTTQAPIALTLVQQTARSNYQVSYAVSLEPKAKVPDLAPASIGAAVVPPDSKLLKLAPNQVAAAYADILVNGDKSKYAPDFEATGDTLRGVVGQAYKAKALANLEKTASLKFSHAVGSTPPTAMATNDSGAIVWTSLTETESLRVVEAGAEVGAGPTSAALSGVTMSKTGIDTTYGYQLAFYVPKAGSDSKITLLGFAQGLVAAKEVK